MKSKNIILSANIVSISLLSYSVEAQVSPAMQDSAHNKMQEKEMQHPKIDHIMMLNGKMLVMKDGKTMPMEKEMTMKNGTKCMTDGTCIAKDGKRTMMKEGEMMDMDGKMMIVLTKDHKTEKDD